MPQTILIILLFIIIAILLTKKERHSFARGFGGAKQAAKNGTSKVAGAYSYFLDQTVRKQQNKEKILAFLQEKGQAGNLEIRGALKISERSVVRYLDELEKEGKVKQVGKTGCNVIYQLKS